MSEQFTVAPKADRSAFNARTGPPNNVLTADEIKTIEADALLHGETQELVGITLRIPAKLTKTRNENFSMVATANDYQSPTEQRMVFLGDPFTANGETFQFMGKLDIARLTLKPKTDS